ncbi:MAG: EcoRV family type II restriction endonuclease [Chlorobi bacterium]|nr:EcoRV family type II restriction endonuclease [Chlorobiota bacterium]
MSPKKIFANELNKFIKTLHEQVSSADGQWTIKGFVDIFKNVFTISSDTKIISKIIEIHLFPHILKFAETHNYKIVLAEHQNYYPDVSFVSKKDENIKFALDFKTTYRNPKNPDICNGFTLGSHGTYFENRKSTKNIQFPYSSYKGHFCLGIIYSRAENSSIDETRTVSINKLKSITSVISNFQFFVTEKWKIASDKGGSGNTANIGSINNIKDLIAGKGLFSKLGEKWFDDYWMNYRKIVIDDGKGGTTKISTLIDFVKYRNGDISKVVSKRKALKKGER